MGNKHGMGIGNRFALPLLVLVLLVFAMTSCGSRSANPAENTENSDARSIRVVTTTGMITDTVRVVGGDRVRVTGLMGPGVDPHLYQASQGDVRKLSEADMIFYNGLHLEGKMAYLLSRMERMKPTFAVADSIPEGELISAPEFGGHFDPHVWFDVRLWIRGVEYIRDALIEFDPEGSAVYEENASKYVDELEELHEWAKHRLQEVPADRRVLVTAHDAFGYFGRAYEIEVVGLQGISTSAEYGLKNVQDLVNLITTRGIKAVFVESSVSDRAIRAVIDGAKARGHDVSIGGTLYSDALGEQGTSAGTYIGMIRHNVDTIVEALK